MFSVKTNRSTTIAMQSMHLLNVVRQKKNNSDTQFTHKHTEMVQHEPTKRKSRSLFKHSRRGVIDTRIKVHIRF